MKRGTILVTATVYWWLVPVAMTCVVLMAVANGVRDYLNGDYLRRDADGHASESDSEGLFQDADEQTRDSGLR